jgi:hypothetical protein
VTRRYWPGRHNSYLITQSPPCALAHAAGVLRVASAATFHRFHPNRPTFVGGISQLAERGSVDQFHSAKRANFIRCEFDEVSHVIFAHRFSVGRAVELFAPFASDGWLILARDAGAMCLDTLCAVIQLYGMAPSVAAVMVTTSFPRAERCRPHERAGGQSVRAYKKPVGPTTRFVWRSRRPRVHCSPASRITAQTRAQAVGPTGPDG